MVGGGGRWRDMGSLDGQRRGGAAQGDSRFGW